MLHTHLQVLAASDDMEAEPTGGTSEQFAAYVKTEAIKWADVVKKSGTKVE